MYAMRINANNKPSLKILTLSFLRTFILKGRRETASYSIIYIFEN